MCFLPRQMAPPIGYLAAEYGPQPPNDARGTTSADGLMDWCDCGAGKRTNFSCCHRGAVLAQVCDTATFNSDKVSEPASKVDMPK